MGAVACFPAKAALAVVPGVWAPAPVPKTAPGAGPKDPATQSAVCATVPSPTIPTGPGGQPPGFACAAPLAPARPRCARAPARSAGVPLRSSPRRPSLGADSFSTLFPSDRAAWLTDPTARLALAWHNVTPAVAACRASRSFSPVHGGGRSGSQPATATNPSQAKPPAALASVAAATAAATAASSAAEGKSRPPAWAGAPDEKKRFPAGGDERDGGRLFASLAECEDALSGPKFYGSTVFRPPQFSAEEHVLAKRIKDTFGEISPKGLLNILDVFLCGELAPEARSRELPASTPLASLTPSHAAHASPRVLYDLGGGAARLALLAFLCFPTLDKVVGIELMPQRYQKGAEVIRALAAAYPKCLREGKPATRPSFQAWPAGSDPPLVLEMFAHPQTGHQWAEPRRLEWQRRDIFDATVEVNEADLVLMDVELDASQQLPLFNLLAHLRPGSGVMLYPSYQSLPMFAAAKKSSRFAADDQRCLQLAPEFLQAQPPMETRFREILTDTFPTSWHGGTFALYRVQYQPKRFP
jgi:hypothetical protein